ncbi:hypothetical protein PENTCL1PPCAC_10455, partial [Pristionchus entomophagus]
KSEFNYYNDSESVGKRYKRIHNMVAPHCEEASCKNADIVLLELYEPVIDIEQSYIRPICLPPTTMSVPEKMMALADEETSGVDSDYSFSSISGIITFDAEGHAILHGIVVNTNEIDEGQQRNIALKMQFLTSFICFHAGICSDGYDIFKDEELHTPFFSADEGGIEYTLETMNSKAYSRKSFLDPNQMER